jgi:hypothetical protein
MTAGSERPHPFDVVRLRTSIDDAPAGTEGTVVEESAADWCIVDVDEIEDVIDAHAGALEIIWRQPRPGESAVA